MAEEALGAEDAVGVAAKGGGQSLALSTRLGLDRFALSGFVHAGDEHSPQKSVKLIKELRQTRRARVDAKTQDHDLAVPLLAYTSCCPAQEAVCCRTKELPQSCQGSWALQTAFGNRVDMSTRNTNKGADDGLEKALAPGTMLGYGSLEDGAWHKAGEPAYLKHAHLAEEHLAHLRKTWDIFGITHWRRPIDSNDFMMVSFLKTEMPGSAAEVMKLIKSLENIGDHVNVVKFVEAREDHETIYMFYEDAPGAGHVPERIFTDKQPFTPQEAARAIQQLSAMALVCTRNHVQHLDLSIWNLMSLDFAKLFPLKVFGIGLAGVVHSGRTTSHAWPDEKRWIARGSFYFNSPELARLRADEGGKMPYKRLNPQLRIATDVWSVGALVYCLLTGYVPFGGHAETEVLQRVQQKELVVDVGLASVEREGVELLERMMQKKSHGRPAPEVIITHAWVLMHARASENRDEVVKIVDRLREFTEMKPLMKALGRMMLNNVQPDKLRGLADTFQMLDIRGDGEVDEDELTSLIVERRDEIAEIWPLLDSDGSGALSLDEFMLANIFSEAVLTERMLVSTFNALDEDCTGAITAGELFRALKRVAEFPMEPEEVVEFIGNADADWDEDMDFDEFRALFPQVNSKNADMSGRRERAHKLHQLAQSVFDRFKGAYESWINEVTGEKNRASEVKSITMPTDTGGSKETITTLKDILERLLQLLKNPPALEITEEEMQQIKTWSPYYQKGSAVFKDDLKGGAPALNRIFKEYKKEWLKAIVPLIHRTKWTEREGSRGQRRTELLALLNELEEFFDETFKVLNESMAEQDHLFEAVEFEEEPPKLPVTRRGLVTLVEEDEECNAAIDAFKARHDQEAANEKNRLEATELQREASRALGIKDKKGTAWLEKRQQRAATKKRNQNRIAAISVAAGQSPGSLAGAAMSRVMTALNPRLGA